MSWRKIRTASMKQSTKHRWMDGKGISNRLNQKENFIRNDFVFDIHIHKKVLSIVTLRKRWGRCLEGELPVLLISYDILLPVDVIYYLSYKCPVWKRGSMNKYMYMWKHMWSVGPVTRGRFIKRILIEPRFSEPRFN